MERQNREGCYSAVAADHRRGANPGSQGWRHSGPQAKALKQISAAVSAIDKQNELMGFKIQRVESKRVDEFENMSDEELRQYVYGNKELDS